jgi:hypothetical protein
MLPRLLNILCEKMPPDIPHTMRVEFSLKREAGNNLIVVEQIHFGEM